MAVTAVARLSTIDLSTTAPYLARLDGNLARQTVRWRSIKLLNRPAVFTLLAHPLRQFARRSLAPRRPSLRQSLRSTPPRGRRGARVLLPQPRSRRSPRPGQVSLAQDRTRRGSTSRSLTILRTLLSVLGSPSRPAPRAGVAGCSASFHSLRRDRARAGPLARGRGAGCCWRRWGQRLSCSSWRPGRAGQES